MSTFALCVLCGQWFRAWSPNADSCGRVGICKGVVCVMLHYDHEAQAEKLAIVDEAMLRSAMAGT